MKITVDKLLQSITESEAFSYTVDLAKQFGFSSTAFISGSIGYTLLKVQAAWMALTSDSLKQVAENTFIDTSSGDYLTIKAKSDFDLDRFEATQSEIKTKIYVTDATPETYEIGEIKIKINGKEFYLSEQLNIELDGYYDVYWLSTLYGSVSRPGTSYVPAFTENPIPNCTFSNISQSDGYYTYTAEGQDEETDASLISRCKTKWGSLSGNGPEDLYLYWAKNSTINGELIGVNRIKIEKSLAQAVGIVIMYCALPTEAPSAEILNAIDANIQKYRAICSTVTVQAATEKEIAYTLTVKVNGKAAGGDGLYSAINSIISDYYSTVDIGGTIIDSTSNGYVVYQNIASAIMSLPGVLNVDFISARVNGSTVSTDDIPLDTNEFPVLASDQKNLITINRIS